MKTELKYTQNDAHEKRKPSSVHLEIDAWNFEAYAQVEQDVTMLF